MRAAGILLAMMLVAALPGSAGGAARSPVKPQRILSMNLCADQLLMLLVAPQRIASVSWIARDPLDSLMARQAARLPINHGQAEDVLRQRPDLILTGSYSKLVTRALVTRLGYHVVTVAPANDFASIRATTRAVAAAVGESARGEALIARMDHDLAILARMPGPGRPVRVAVWEGSGFGAPKGSLMNSVIEAAGAINIGAGVQGSPINPDVESLIALRPDLLVQGAYGPREVGLRDNISRHRLVRQMWRGRTLFVPQSAYLCGTPLVVRQAMALKAQIARSAKTL